ncbi:MAG: hypothetical protein AAFO87_04300 [Cyanobacteria bacterium J06607_6]
MERSDRCADHTPIPEMSAASLFGYLGTVVFLQLDEARSPSTPSLPLESA